MKDTFKGDWVPCSPSLGKKGTGPVEPCQLHSKLDLKGPGDKAWRDDPRTIKSVWETLFKGRQKSHPALIRTQGRSVAQAAGQVVRSHLGGEGSFIPQSV